MKTIVIYNSKTGFTKRYAAQLEKYQKRGFPKVGIIVYDE